MKKISDSDRVEWGKGREEEDRLAKEGASKIMADTSMKQAYALVEVLRYRLQENGRDIAQCRNLVRLLALELLHAGVKQRAVPGALAKMVNSDYYEFNGGVKLGLRVETVRQVILGPKEGAVKRGRGKR